MIIPVRSYIKAKIRVNGSFQVDGEGLSGGRAVLIYFLLVALIVAGCATTGDPPLETTDEAKIDKAQSNQKIQEKTDEPDPANETITKEELTKRSTKEKTPSAAGRGVTIADLYNEKGNRFYYGRDYDGRDREKDYVESAKAYRKAALKGHAHAQYMLGYQYRFEQGVSKDDVKAERWYRAAANQGNTDAMTELAEMYINGITVQKDIKQAKALYKRAADAGDSWALRVIKHLPALDSQALRRGISAYESGNYQKAFSLLKPLAELGVAAAETYVGYMYSYGLGTKKDSDWGTSYLSDAAYNGDPEAQEYWGEIYYLQKDYQEALKWYRRAAYQNNREAQFQLGYMYSKGQGVKQDYARAASWYRKAASQNLAVAQYNLGVIYANGDGVSQSKHAAADWFYKAGQTYLKNGDRDGALTCLDRIERVVPGHFLAKRLMKEIYGEIPEKKAGE